MKVPLAYENQATLYMDKNRAGNSHAQSEFEYNHGVGSYDLIKESKFEVDKCDFIVDIKTTPEPKQLSTFQKYLKFFRNIKGNMNRFYIAWNFIYHTFSLLGFFYHEFWHILIAKICGVKLKTTNYRLFKINENSTVIELPEWVMNLETPCGPWKKLLIAAAPFYGALISTIISIILSITISPLFLLILWYHLVFYDMTICSKADMIMVRESIFNIFASLEEKEYVKNIKDLINLLKKD